MVSRVAAVLIVSQDAVRTADFYRSALGIPLEEERHAGGGESLHYGCTVQGVHFAVHPVENFQAAPETGPGGTRVAFGVESADDMARRLREQGVEFVGPVDLGWSKMVLTRDPDGNRLELVQLTA